jgi:5-formyltetrahydrofolate cyclo-ligase
MTPNDLGEDPDMTSEKAAIRDRVWTALEAAGVVPPGVHGHIPDFAGSADAARRLAELAGWQQARTAKANPDRAQQPARALALEDGKVLFMAVPRLAEPHPFLRLDPAVLGEDSRRFADRRMAAQAAQPVGVDELPMIDVIICGSVAVNPDGVRIGKGAGYADIEVALLAQAGLLKPDTIIITTVHELQVLDEPLPRRQHDFTVDHILTPDRVITCGPPRRPAGIDWDELSADQLRAIPVLQALADAR